MAGCPDLWDGRMVSIYTSCHGAINSDFFHFWKCLGLKRKPYGHPIYGSYFEITILQIRWWLNYVSENFQRSYFLRFHITVHSREDSKKEAEVMIQITRVLSLFTNLFLAAPIPGECRLDIKRESEGKWTLLAQGLLWAWTRTALLSILILLNIILENRL